MSGWMSSSDIERGLQAVAKAIESVAKEMSSANSLRDQAVRAQERLEAEENQKLAQLIKTIIPTSYMVPSNVIESVARSIRRRYQLTPIPEEDRDEYK